MSEQTVQSIADTPLLAAVDHAEGLSLLLKRADHAIALRLSVSLEEADLTMEHWRILAVLLARPGLRMTTIAEAAVVPGATLTRHMDRLVEHGWVIRRVDPADKRRVVAALSPRGQELARRLRDEEAAAEQQLAASLGPAGLAALARFGWSGPGA